MIKLTDEQLQILDKEHEMHVSGKSKSYTREEAIQIIKVNCIFNLSPLATSAKKT